MYAFQRESTLFKRVWLNGWVLVYELSDFGLEARCSHLNYIGVDVTNLDHLIWKLKIWVCIIYWKTTTQHGGVVPKTWYARNKHVCRSFLTPSDFIEKETPVQVFSYEFCKIFQNSNYLEHLWTTATIEELIVFQINIFPTTQMEKFPVTHFRSFLQSCSV